MLERMWRKGNPLTLLVLTLSNAASASLFSPRLLVVDVHPWVGNEALWKMHAEFIASNFRNPARKCTSRGSNFLLGNHSLAE